MFQNFTSMQGKYTDSIIVAIVNQLSYIEVRCMYVHYTLRFKEKTPQFELTLLSSLGRLG